MTTFLECAQAAVNRGMHFAHQHDLELAVVVIDATGSVCAAARMDGTRPSTYEVVHAKANTALQLKGPTATLEDALPLDRKVAVANLLDRIVFIGGGVPIIDDGRLLGAIGVGGAAEDQDVECAELCLEEFRAAWPEVRSG